MTKKERKLPNKVFGERNELMPDKQSKIIKPNNVTYPANLKYTFTADSVPIDTELLKNIETFPAFYTPQERARAELANLRFKAKKLLEFGPFSAGKAYAEFGTVKFPRVSEIECYKCGNKMYYVVDFFVHGILDHGNSLQNVEMIFQNLLNRIESKI